MLENVCLLEFTHVSCFPNVSHLLRIYQAKIVVIDPRTWRNKIRKLQTSLDSMPSMPIQDPARKCLTTDFDFWPSNACATPSTIVWFGSFLSATFMRHLSWVVKDWHPMVLGSYELLVTVISYGPGQTGNSTPKKFIFESFCCPSPNLN